MTITTFWVKIHHMIHRFPSIQGALSSSPFAPAVLQRPAPFRSAQLPSAPGRHWSDCGSVAETTYLHGRCIIMNSVFLAMKYEFCVPICFSSTPFSPTSHLLTFPPPPHLPFQHLSGRPEARAETSVPARRPCWMRYSSSRGPSRRRSSTSAVSREPPRRPRPGVER